MDVGGDRREGAEGPGPAGGQQEACPGGCHCPPKKLETGSFLGAGDSLAGTSGGTQGPPVLLGSVPCSGARAGRLAGPRERVCPVLSGLPGCISSDLNKLTFPSAVPLCGHRWPEPAALGNASATCAASSRPSPVPRAHAPARYVHSWRDQSRSSCLPTAPRAPRTAPMGCGLTCPSRDRRRPRCSCQGSPEASRHHRDRVAAPSSAYCQATVTSPQARGKLLVPAAARSLCPLCSPEHPLPTSLEVSALGPLPPSVTGPWPRAHLGATGAGSHPHHLSPAGPGGTLAPAADGGRNSVLRALAAAGGAQQDPPPSGGGTSRAGTGARAADGWSLPGLQGRPRGLLSLGLLGVQLHPGKKPSRAVVGPRGCPSGSRLPVARGEVAIKRGCWGLEDSEPGSRAHVGTGTLASFSTLPSWTRMPLPGERPRCVAWGVLPFSGGPREEAGSLP